MNRPEYTETGQPIDLEMDRAGFRRTVLGRSRMVRPGIWVSAVSEDCPDRYYHHPIRKQSIFVELKAPTGRARPGQLQWMAEHEGNPTPAVMWHTPDLCVAWLVQEGYRVETADGPRYPFGWHAPSAGRCATFEELMQDE